MIFCVQYFAHNISKKYHTQNIVWTLWKDNMLYVAFKKVLDNLVDLTKWVTCCKTWMAVDGKVAWISQAAVPPTRSTLQPPLVFLQPSYNPIQPSASLFSPPTLLQPSYNPIQPSLFPIQPSYNPDPNPLQPTLLPLQPFNHTLLVNSSPLQLKLWCLQPRGNPFPIENGVCCCIT